MGVVNVEMGTRVDEVADGIFRISTPLPPSVVPGGFSFNQYLVVDDEPLLFHTGPRRFFPLVRDAIASVLPLERLRWLGVSHVEADECGALNALLTVAPQAQPVCSRVAALTSLEDMADRPPRALADGETLSLGRHSVTWLDTPHLPHGWECGYLFEASTRTLLCGDLFTQPGGAACPPLTEGDILGPSEAFRGALDYFSHSDTARGQLARLARVDPRTLACMHGSAWAGEGGALLQALADSMCGPALRA
ncbi:MBL fold metallo-hydrolase [Aggregicoccus sp. 17bor-14]|uniref:MBL fold metallo-hydrolase n=1 Tax=Myxococcaceae TaxID=31 RepID=UPI00129C5826|nr:MULTISPECIES: MBL fold metallo-hydrolase [Myxococcaceae]MBF5042098.1 MBL fold metallo-hydrolase [Simulacricoccus sp. 17bor-14]MRI87875.1 MBL fold metallo-hydrolase [Aggregicoccus sp. 17bor-14]